MNAFKFLSSFQVKCHHYIFCLYYNLPVCRTSAVLLPVTLQLCNERFESSVVVKVVCLDLTNLLHSTEQVGAFCYNDFYFILFFWRGGVACIWFTYKNINLLNVTLR